MRWRAGIAFLGLVFAGLGAALILWPWLLAWAAGAGFGLLGTFLLVSAVFARSR
jgi:hypothetical protein